MRKIPRKLLPVLMAAICVSAVMSTGALAATKKGELVNEKGGALVKNKFSGETEAAEFETGTGTVITCKASVSTLSGAMSSTKAGTATLTLTGCAHGLVCKTTSAKNRGEWVLPLKLSVIVKEEVDQVVAEVPETALTCEGTESKVRGSFYFGNHSVSELSTKSWFAADGVLPTTNPLQFKFGTKAWESLKLYATFETTFEEKMEYV